MTDQETVRISGDIAPFAGLLARRDDYRARMKSARMVVAYDDTKPELSPLGQMKWYIDPTMSDVAMNTLLFYELTIPPGSRSGRIRAQGGTAAIVVQGCGHSIVNGKRYDWEAINSILLPILREGVDVQHFNDSPTVPVRMVVAMPNLLEPLGVDLGCGLEIIEEAPEYATQGRAQQ